MSFFDLFTKSNSKDKNKANDAGYNQYPEQTANTGYNANTNTYNPNLQGSYNTQYSQSYNPVGGQPAQQYSGNTANQNQWQQYPQQQQQGFTAGQGQGFNYWSQNSGQTPNQQYQNVSAAITTGWQQTPTTTTTTTTQNWQQSPQQQIPIIPTTTTTQGWQSNNTQGYSSSGWDSNSNNSGGWQNNPTVVSQTTRVDTNLSNRNIGNQPNNNQNGLNDLLASNLYPSLPTMGNTQDKSDKDEIQNNLGWVQEQSGNKSDGMVQYIEELGASKFVKPGDKIKLGQTQQSNNNPNWNQMQQGTSNQQQGNTQKYGGNQGFQSQVFSIASALFQLNPIFETQKLVPDLYNPQIKYKIIPYLDQKKALDVCSISDTKRNYKKNSMMIWDYHGGPNQLFYIKKQYSGYYIINVARGFAVQPPARNEDENQSMIARPRMGAPQQQWRMQFSNDSKFYGFVQIINLSTGKALDLYFERSNNGTAVIQWNSTGKKNQMWRIVPF